MTDLRGTPIDHAIRDYLDDFAMGNEGKVTTNRLEQNGSKLALDYTILHRHNMGWPLGVIYNIEMKIAAAVDILNPVTWDGEVCVEVLKEKICVSIRDIIAIIIGLFSVPVAKAVDEIGRDKLEELPGKLGDVFNSKITVSRSPWTGHHGGFRRY